MIAAQRMGDGSHFLLFSLLLHEHSGVKSDMVRRPWELREWLLREICSDCFEANTDIVKYRNAGFGVSPLYGLPKEALA